MKESKEEGSRRQSDDFPGCYVGSIQFTKLVKFNRSTRDCTCRAKQNMRLEWSEDKRQLSGNVTGRSSEMALAVRFVLLFVCFPAVSFYECYWGKLQRKIDVSIWSSGVDGYNDHSLWKKECHGRQCIKWVGMEAAVFPKLFRIVDEPGVVTYNCDTTAYCRVSCSRSEKALSEIKKTGCASNHLGGKTCCCDSQLCNSSAHSLFSIVFLVYVGFVR